MEFNDEIITIIGHNGSAIWNGEYFIFFGGYEEAYRFNGVIVTEDLVESAINHEVLHCLMDYLGEDAEKLDNIWYVYGNCPKYLEGCSYMGLGSDIAE